MRRSILAALLFVAAAFVGGACELETFCCDDNADGLGDRPVYPGCEAARGEYVTTICG